MDTLTNILRDAEAISFGVRDRALLVYETDANVHCFATEKALTSAREVVTKAEEGMKMFSDGHSHAEVANRIGRIADLL